ERERQQRGREGGDQGESEASERAPSGYDEGQTRSQAGADDDQRRAGEDVGIDEIGEINNRDGRREGHRIPVPEALGEGVLDAFANRSPGYGRTVYYLHSAEGTVVITERRCWPHQVAGVPYREGSS